MNRLLIAEPAGSYTLNLSHPGGAAIRRKPECLLLEREVVNGSNGMAAELRLGKTDLPGQVSLTLRLCGRISIAIVWSAARSE